MAIIIELIYTQSKKGLGQGENDPVRLCDELWTKKGVQVAYHDPCRPEDDFLACASMVRFRISRAEKEEAIRLTPMENRILMKKCLDEAIEIWDRVFYTGNGYHEDMVPTAEAIAQIAVVLFQDARAPESVELTELGEIKQEEPNNSLAGSDATLKALAKRRDRVPLLRPVPPRPKKGESK